MTDEQRQGDKIRRDYRGRPYIWLPDGSKEVTYTRTSTFAKALSDSDSLSWWRQQMLVRGIARDPRVLQPTLNRFADTGELDLEDEETKAAIAETIVRASDTGGANDAANWGTTMHALTDIVDFSDQPLTRDMWDLPQSIWDTLDAYVELTKDMVMVSGEQFVVNDLLRTAGSYDRTFQWKGESVVGDLKTGTVRFPDHGIQTALYANSKHYDIATGRRVPGPVDDASTKVGVIVHLPRPGLKNRNGKPVEPSLIPVDLEAGWELANLAEQVRVARRTKLVLVQEGE